MHNDDRFGKWLKTELAWRGWTRAEFAKRAGLSRSHISRILSGATDPGEDFCNKTAVAMALPPARVFRLAGLIHSYKISDAYVQRIVESLLALTDEQRAMIEYGIELMLLQNSLGNKPLQKLDK